MHIVGAKYHDQWTYYTLVDRTYRRPYNLLDIAPYWSGLEPRRLLMDTNEAGGPTLRAKYYAGGLEQEVGKFIQQNMDEFGALPSPRPHPLTGEPATEGPSTWLFHAITVNGETLKWLREETMNELCGQVMSDQIGVLVSMERFAREVPTISSAERFWCKPTHQGSPCSVVEGECTLYKEPEISRDAYGRGFTGYTEVAKLSTNPWIKREIMIRRTRKMVFMSLKELNERAKKRHEAQEARNGRF